MTDNPFFLIPIGEDDYDLGEYSSLAPVISYFVDDDLDSFARKSQAAAGGFNAASILDSLWANPEFCEAGETPLECEFRAVQPSIALIMFGTNDVFYLNEAQFDFFLRSIVVQTIRNGTLPIMSTFPHRPEFPEKSVLYNQLVALIATEYDVPLINLWQALSTLPNQGIDPEDTTHLSTPESGAVCYFIDENMQAGFTVRNLLTLQTLDVVLQAVQEP
ncbi:MAG: SGNH/GDSL hydrolase family protein [Chloroflexi bacterium]|nr:SGNH/GDSL hydrolase family protein [Chloroflexota bacterium]